ncbi:hypothetical protein [Devosia alba]|uniref:hypothetical protein n=1 Tax=Devosia alba TaxID=3152360 RepID=UPI003266175F
MQSHNEEYGILDVLAVLRRIWILLLLLPLGAAALVGIWAYSSDPSGKDRLVISSRISLSVADQNTLDFQQILETVASDIGASGSDSAAVNLTIFNLTQTPVDGMSIVQLTIDFRPDVDGTRLIHGMLDIIGDKVARRHLDPEQDASTEALEARHATLLSLWTSLTDGQDLPTEPDRRPPTDGVSNLAELSIALSLLEDTLSDTRNRAEELWSVLEPPGEPAATQRSFRWVRLPIAAFVGTLLSILLIALTVDTIRMAMRRRIS